MLLTILFSGLLAQADPVLPDTVVPKVFPNSGAGALLGPSFVLADNRDFSITSGVVLGLYFQQSLSPSVSLQFELQAKYARGYRLNARFIDTLVVPGGIGTRETLLEANAFWFFETPVLLKFQRDRWARFAFFTGVRPSWNHIQRSSRSSRSAVSYFVYHPDPYENLTTRPGIHRFSLGIPLGVTYALSRRLQLDMRYTQGLIDLTADNFFKNKSNELNSDLQITLRANF